MNAPAASTSFSRLIARAADGEATAVRRALTRVHAELRAVANDYLGHADAAALEPTVALHEAYRRLVQHPPLDWSGLSGYLLAAAGSMRRILVHHARARGLDRAKIDLVDLDRVLRRLEHLDPGKTRLVELRYFAGLRPEDAACVLGIPREAALEQWRMARAWLHREMKDRP